MLSHTLDYGEDALMKALEIFSNVKIMSVVEIWIASLAKPKKRDTFKR